MTILSYSTALAYITRVKFIKLSSYYFLKRLQKLLFKKCRCIIGSMLTNNVCFKKIQNNSLILVLTQSLLISKYYIVNVKH
jgi:hypothetical protein